MSEKTFHADPRYREVRRELETVRHHIQDGALDRTIQREAELIDRAHELAIEHGWNPQTQTWEGPR